MKDTSHKIVLLTVLFSCTLLYTQLLAVKNGNDHDFSKRFLVKMPIIVSSS